MPASKPTQKKMKDHDPNQNLLAIVDGVRSTQTPEQLVEFIIHLYSEEFIKANDEIARLRINAKSDADVIEELRKLIEQQKEANDNLFKIKQKTVVANRDLIAQRAKKDEALRMCQTLLVRKATAPECSIAMADPDSLVAQQIADALK